MTKNIFIIFAPGLGGNHLANIFSLDNNYRNRIEYDTYVKKEKNAHISLQNMNLKSIEKYLDQLVDQNNVFCGHWTEYVYFKESNFSQHFQNRSFCVIQMPQMNSPLYHRLLNVSKVSNPWVLNEITLMYKKEHITKLINEVDSNFVYVWPEMLCNCNIQDLIDDVNNQGLDIHPDIEKAQAYHNLWLTKNFSDYNNTAKSHNLEQDRRL